MLLHELLEEPNFFAVLFCGHPFRFRCKPKQVQTRFDAVPEQIVIVVGFVLEQSLVRERVIVLDSAETGSGLWWKRVELEVKNT
jgi:hypothetical protein